jgi:uncharacterized membrane protein YphA (DoxX/SURF4 family)
LGFHEKINNGIFSNILAYNASQALIIIAILLLLVAPILMILGVIQDNNLLIKTGSLSLILFVFIATLIYHPITDKTQINNILKNIAILGGLIMLLVQVN